MKITIIPIDGAVYKEGLSFSGLDLSFVPSNVHALQWDNDAGWIEFKSEAEFRKPPNENITTLPDWVTVAMTKWECAKVIREAEEVAILAAAALTQPTTVGAQEL